MSKFRNIVLPATTTPSSPKDGQIYHDSTLNQIRVYIDGSWISLGVGTGLLTSSDVGLGNVQNVDTTNPTNINQNSSYRFVTDTEKTSWDSKQPALGFTPENSANKGIANGYVPLDSTTKIASIYLPSYVDDVLEYSALSSFPESGSVGLIYIALDTNKIYRWSGSTYTEISPSPGSTDSVTEGSTNLYFTTARAQSAISGAASTIVSSDLTTNRILLSDGSGKVSASSVNNTTLGYLDATSSIQTQLNGKEPTLTKGNLTESVSSILTITNGTNSVIGSGTSIQVKQANDNQSGFLLSDDWAFFNQKLNGNEIDYSLRTTMGSATLSGNNGTTSATTGTIALANFSGSTTIGKIPHVTLNTTSTAGSTTGMRITTSPICIGGGFKFGTLFQISDASNVANCRHFFGANLSSSATAINSSSNNNQIMNTLTNFFAFAHDSFAGDTNFCIYHNGNTAGNTTRISLGSSFPVTNTGEIYQVKFYNPINSLNVYYRVTALVANVTASGVIIGTSSNLPTSSQLFVHNERFNGGSSASVRFEGSSIFMYTFG